MKPDSRILILPAGLEQVHVIRKARELGLTVVAIDSNPRAEGFEYADVRETASPQDIGKCLKIAERHRVAAVVADQCDYSLFTSACISTRLGISGPSLEAAHYATNKKLMRQRCQEAEFIQPPFRVCRTLEEAQRAVQEIGLPVILKPTDNRGCFGITKVDHLSQLLEAFFEALVNAHSREILVEKFVRGTMVTIDGYFFRPEAYRVLGIASKKKIEGRRCVDMEVIYPAELSSAVIQRLLDYNAKVVQALKLSYGPTHGEYIVAEDGHVYLIEIANRGGGVLTAPIILPAISSAEIPELLIRNAFGEFPLVDVPPPERPINACVLSFMDFGARGILKAVHGLKEAGQIPGVLAIHLFAKQGQELPAITHGPSRHGFVIAKSPSREGAREIVQRVLSTIRLETQP